MVRLLVEEARDALPLPNRPQCERDVRLVISTSPHAPIPRSGFVLRSLFGRRMIEFARAQASRYVAAGFGTLTVLLNAMGAYVSVQWEGQKARLISIVHETSKIFPPKISL
ncbi:hypothetical protein [Mesorhizobium sp.]|uniref:hypothetical protein n=1 Tax=Mesorhizobium sp. TaxID=1871066 RepID=UPI000FE4D108|nr:hypothetical protein [Mesorhizobium sp.]RWB67928.1 MAG: hypothetical protein EOQ49_23920 [Mesorhizobium sp.]